MSKGYVTPIEVATSLGLDYSDPQVILDVNVAVDFIEDAVDQYCNTTFINETATSKIYSGSGLQMLSLGLYLRTFTSAWVLTSEGDESYELTDVVPMPQPAKRGVYRWLERRQSNVYLGDVLQTFPKGLNNIKVTGDWGFTEAPSAVKLAVMMGVRHFFELREQSDVKKTESGFGRLVEQASSDSIHYLPHVARAILDSWKNGNFVSE